MSILVSDIVSRCESALDAEGFERYLFDNDYRPAINYAMEWIVSVFNKAFAENKLSEESMRELVFAKVFITSAHSRINLNDLNSINNEVWSILAVYPEIEYMGVLPNAGNNNSVFCPNVSFLRSYKSAKRGTLEEVNINRRNPFMAGNEVNVCEETRDYIYVYGVNYSGSYASNGDEITLYPPYPLKPVAVVYLAYPNDIHDITDVIPFPQSLTNLIVNKSLEWISYKQGDKSTLKQVTDDDVKKLVSLMI